MRQVSSPWGLLPDGWKLSTIKKEMIVVTDYVANGSFASLAENVQYSNTEEYAILIRLYDYNNNFSGNFVYVNEHAYNFLSKSKLYGDEIIISNVGANVGTVFKCPRLSKPMTLGPNSIVVKLNGNNDFYFYWFKSRYGKYCLDSIVSGSAQPKFNKTHFKEMSIPVPPLVEQEKIASILSALDNKIAVNRRICANLEAQAQALFKSWFVDFTPFKDQPFVDSELGPIPQGWKVGTLGDIANIIMGQSPAGSSYNERGNGVIFYQGRTEFGFRFPNVRLYTTMPKRYAEPMSILLSVRAPVGDINVAIEKCCIGRGLASISSKRGLHSFLLYLVKSLKIRLEVFNGEGTVFGSINKNTLTQFKIIIPPIEMQEKFNEIIQRHDCMVLELHKEIINLSTQRDTLLPKLMSGEIKL